MKKLVLFCAALICAAAAVRAENDPKPFQIAKAVKLGRNINATTSYQSVLSTGNFAGSVYIGKSVFDLSGKELLRRRKSDTELHGRIVFIGIRGESNADGVLLYADRVRRRVVQTGICPRRQCKRLLLRVKIKKQAAKSNCGLFNSVRQERITFPCRHQPSRYLKYIYPILPVSVQWHC